MISEKEILEKARFIVNNNSTVRKTAEEFGSSKSSIHNHLTKELKRIDLELYKQVMEVLKKNKAERHIRGGYATKLKYSKTKNSGS